MNHALKNHPMNGTIIGMSMFAVPPEMLAELPPAIVRQVEAQAVACRRKMEACKARMKPTSDPTTVAMKARLDAARRKF